MLNPAKSYKVLSRVKLSWPKSVVVSTFNVAIVAMGRKIIWKSNKCNFNREKKTEKENKWYLLAHLSSSRKITSWTLGALINSANSIASAGPTSCAGRKPVGLLLYGSSLASAEEPAPLRAEPLENSTINRVTNSSPTPNNTQGKWMRLAGKTMKDAVGGGCRLWVV